ncbi:hypothetical protein E2C01_064727 [Portunus trituberculatus]|uniref:Uncharacterized protein n=1 Tax=Portunus trituberculatus TaxID=210409 RepID=A0A5B7HP60_PORTR|nr:hypothetical protein [Portunus trituberculatus]
MKKENWKRICGSGTQKDEEKERHRRQVYRYIGTVRQCSNETDEADHLYDTDQPQLSFSRQEQTTSPCMTE